MTSATYRRRRPFHPISGGAGKRYDPTIQGRDFPVRWPAVCVVCRGAIAVDTMANFAPRADGTRGLRHAGCPAPTHAYASASAGPRTTTTTTTNANAYASNGQTHAAPTPATRDEAALEVLAAVEQYVILAASESPSDVATLDVAWQRYQRCKALMLAPGTTDEGQAARRKALALALRLADALNGSNVLDNT